MIEINLLPPNLQVKKREPFKLPSLPIIPIAAGAVGLLVVILILLLLLVQVKNFESGSLKKKIASISSANKEAISIDKSLKELSAKADAIGRLTGSRFNVARKLNDLSDSMVSGVWLKTIDVKKTQTVGEMGSLGQLFILEGSSIAYGENEEGSIGKFVNSLKGNKSFSSDFDEIELAKVERKKLQDTEIMNFVIICHFKNGKGF